MYEFNVKYAGSFSPIMLDLSHHYEERSKIKGGGGDGSHTTYKTTPTTSIDIEDLFRDPGRVMPPCLSRVVKQDWYKSKDRLNLVAYLIDMGYQEKEKVVNIMCRNRDNASDRAIIESIYNDKAKKKLEKLPHHRISLPCSSIINSNFEEGNVLRCVYEERKNGDVRVKSSVGEQDVFKHQCICENNLKHVNLKSPMNFIDYMVRVGSHLQTSGGGTNPPKVYQTSC
jgi:hypothetical protein